MKQLFHSGDTKTFSRRVREEDCATFDSGQVHPVYATFALARDAEWCCRLFVLEMKDADEEGIGTMLSIQHVSPALIGATVVFTGTVKEIKGNSLICTFEARSGDRLIATGETGQKILQKEKLEKHFQQFA